MSTYLERQAERERTEGINKITGELESGNDTLMLEYQTLANNYEITRNEALKSYNYSDENFIELQNMIVSNSEESEQLKTKIETYKICYAKHYGRDVADKYEKNILNLRSKIKQTSRLIERKKEQYDQQFTTANTVSTQPSQPTQEKGIDGDMFFVPFIVISVIAIGLITFEIIRKIKKSKGKKKEISQKGDFYMLEKIKSICMGTAGFAWHIVLCVCSLLPLFVIDLPLLIEFLIIFAILTLPIIGTITDVVLWICGFFIMITGPQDWIAILYYVVGTIYLLPTIISLIGSLCDIILHRD